MYIKTLSKKKKKMPDLEKRVLDILENLKELPDIKKRQKDILDEISKEIKTALGQISHNVQNINQSGQNIRENINNSNQNVNNTSDSLEKVKKIYHIFKRNIENISRTFERSSREFRSFVEEGPFEKLKSVLQNLPAIGGIATGIFSALDMFNKIVDNYSRIARSGAVFADGLEEIIAVGKDLRLSFEETGEFFAKYANLLNRGNREFVDYIERSMKTSDSILRYGYDIETLRDSAAEFLTIQRNLGFLRQINADEQSRLFHETIENFYGVSTRLGIAATELVESMKSLSEDPEARIALRNLNESGRQMLSLMEKVAPNLSRFMAEALTKKGLERAEDYEKYAVTEVFPVINEIFNMLISGSGNAEEMLIILSQNRDLIARTMQRAAFSGMNDIVNVLNELDLLAHAVVDNIETGQKESENELGRQLIETRNKIRAQISDMSAELIRRLSNAGGLAEKLSDFLVRAAKQTTNILQNTFWIDLLTDFANAAITLTKSVLNMAKSINRFFGFEDSPFYTIATTAILAFLPKSIFNLFKAIRPQTASNIAASLSSILGNRITGFLISTLSSVKKTFLLLTSGIFAATELGNFFEKEKNETQKPEVTAPIETTPAIKEPTRATIPTIGPRAELFSPANIAGQTLATTQPLTPEATKALTETGNTGESSMSMKLGKLSEEMKELRDLNKNIAESYQKKIMVLQNIQKQNEKVTISISDMVSP